jgi:threonine aldolase
MRLRSERLLAEECARQVFWPPQAFMRLTIMLQGMATDHQHAKALAAALSPLNYVSSVMPVETNIVIFEVAAGFKAENIIHLLAEKGIACSMMGTNIRIVTHLDISPEMIDMAIENIIHLHPSGHK